MQTLIIGLIFGWILAAGSWTVTEAQTTSTTTTTTTTSTLPGACVVEVSLPSLTCRVEALLLRLGGATDLGRTKDTLVGQAAKLHERLGETGDLMAAGDTRKARTRLKKAGRVLISMGFRLRSLTGRRQIAPATRAELQEVVRLLDADAKALRSTL